MMHKLTKARIEGKKRKEKRKGKGEIVATFKANEKSLNRTVAACYCGQMQLRASRSKVESITVVCSCSCFYSGSATKSSAPHSPSPLQLPPRGDGAAVARGERIVPPLLDTLSSRLDCRIEGERKAGAIVSFGHRRQSPPTFLSPVGKKISSFNRASGLLAWLMAGKVRGKFHHRIQIVGGNLWRERTN